MKIEIIYLSHEPDERWLTVQKQITVIDVLKATRPQEKRDYPLWVLRSTAAYLDKRGRN